MNVMNTKLENDLEYQLYCDYSKSCETPDMFLHVDDPQKNCTRLMTKDEFTWLLNNNEKIKKYWDSLKIFIN